jgi:hypothetical protein
MVGRCWDSRKVCVSKTKTRMKPPHLAKV